MKKAIFTLTVLALVIGFVSTSHAKQPKGDVFIGTDISTGSIVYNCPWC